MSGQFDGKVAFVTGAASGIGEEVALAFAAASARVVVADIAETGGQETVAAIKRAGGEGTFIRCDVGNAADARSAVAATVATYGRLDCAFNNAGVFGERFHVHEYPEEEFERLIRIHLFGGQPAEVAAAVLWLCSDAASLVIGIAMPIDGGWSCSMERLQIDAAHLRFRVARAGGGAGRDRYRDAREVVRAQLHLERAEIFLEPREPLGAGNRDHVRALCQ
jgi:NAD(P)-dependent dehydrogenase (short-subunit alcohol dehydrogenase family)